MKTHEFLIDTYIRLFSTLKFLKVSIFIIVLIGIHAALESGVATILITHLTGDGLQLPRAASIVNLQDGISSFLLLLVAYASNTKLGSFGTVVFTSYFYFVGLLLLFFDARKQKDDMRSLFVAAIFIALGRSGRDISLKQFLDDQCKAEWLVHDSEEGKDDESGQYKKCWRIASVIGVIVSVCVSWFNQDIEWENLCKISVIAMGLGFAFFLAGIPFYHVINVKHPSRTSSCSSTSTSSPVHMDTALRCVDNKAANIKPFPRVDQIWELKKMLSMIPLWTSFLVFGLLQATANVFFYEQFDSMDSRLAPDIPNVPVVIFAVIMKFTCFTVSYICEKRIQSYWGKTKNDIPRRVMLMRIGLGLAIAPVCCVIAWRVESYRSEQRAKYGISTNVVWLIPQFVLLGILEGLVFDGIGDFFSANFSHDFVKKYGPSFTQLAPNIGHFISLALVLNLRSLFGDGLDTSRLGLYYAILGYVCFVNFVYYCYVATYFVKRPDRGEACDQDEDIAD